MQLAFGPRERTTKTLGNSMLKPPRVDDAFGSLNVVRPSQITQHIMEMLIIHKSLSLFMVINLFKLIMRHNICMVTFMEISYGEIALLA